MQMYSEIQWYKIEMKRSMAFVSEEYSVILWIAI